MADPLKYAVIERERRFLVETIPEGVTRTISIEDHYILGTRLRLRQASAADGTRERKLGHKVRLGEGSSAIACTSLYLDDAEWDLLRSLPARSLRKTRHVVDRAGAVVAIDELEDGTLLAEIDDGEDPPVPVPAWLAVIDDVTDDESWTGSALSR
ncbi:MAG: hypothetical protein ACOH1Y_13850 [Propionicimonas sp.]